MAAPLDGPNLGMHHMRAQHEALLAAAHSSTVAAVQLHQRRLHGAEAGAEEQGVVALQEAMTPGSR